MAKKRYTLRFYKHHDRDLVTFMLTHDFDIVRAIYSSLTAFVNQEVFVIDIQQKTKEIPEQIKWSYIKILSLDTEKDQKAIGLLDKIHKGAKNNFLKELLRQYLCFPFSEESVDNINDYDEISEMFNIFKNGKRVVKAGKTDDQLKKTNPSRIENSTKNELNSMQKADYEDKTDNELNSDNEDLPVKNKAEDTINDNSSDMSEDELLNIYTGMM